MVELGERQWDENEALGQFIAQHDLDLVALIGDDQTAPIQAGLSAAQFPDERIEVFSSLSDAQTFLKQRLEPGDVVLYENDLPDQYSV
jgi:UDP-N-acetylmuramoyl-tripeptide--D-alanyl-D-alanine ligase